jgi:hypothetical protein
VETFAHSTTIYEKVWRLCLCASHSFEEGSSRLYGKKSLSSNKKFSVGAFINRVSLSHSKQSASSKPPGVKPFSEMEKRAAIDSTQKHQGLVEDEYERFEIYWPVPNHIQRPTLQRRARMPADPPNFSTAHHGGEYA